MPTVGILTTLADFKPEYSIAGVVNTQLKMLRKYNYPVVLFVLNIFHDEANVPEGVEIRKIVPQLILEPYAEFKLGNLEPDVEKAKLAFAENMKDIDVMLTHDIIFINSYLPYNEALRRGIREGSLSHIQWLHWMHSGPSFRNLDGSVLDDLHTLPDNSKLIYMNNTDILRAAEHFNTLPKNVRMVYNTMDIRDLYHFHPLTHDLIEAYDLMKPQYLASYPLSTTRMDDIGKKLRKAIRIMAELKRRGNSVAFIIPNAHANAQHEKDAIEEMYQYAWNLGLTRQELIFTSLFQAPKWEQGVPHEVVMNLFTLSNLFLFPSHSENCPLVLLEAMAAKNMLVLNGDFPAFYEFGKENAQYYRFGSTVAPSPEFPDGEDKYFKDIALLIESEYSQNRALKAQTRIRQEFNEDYIFKHQLEPAIAEAYDSRKD